MEAGDSPHEFNKTFDELWKSSIAHDLQDLSLDEIDFKTEFPKNSYILRNVGDLSKFSVSEKLLKWLTQVIVDDQRDISSILIVSSKVDDNCTFLHSFLMQTY